MHARMREYFEHGAAVVAVEGEIDMATAGALRSVLDRAVAQRTRDVIVDLAAVGFMDSSGLRVLLHAQEQLAADNRRLVARQARRPVRRLFEVADAPINAA